MNGFKSDVVKYIINTFTQNNTFYVYRRVILLTTGSDFGCKIL